MNHYRVTDTAGDTHYLDAPDAISALNATPDSLTVRRVDSDGHNLSDQHS
jgi:hypothetical protein